MSEHDKIRLVTFNIKHGAKAHRYRGHPKRVVAACAELDADILALQEVDDGVMRSGLRNIPRMVAEKTGMQFVFDPTLMYKIGRYGNALLVRGDVKLEQSVKLEGTARFRLQVLGRRLSPFGYEPRGAIVATAAIGERKLSVAATHLSTDKRLSQRQLKEVLAALASRPHPQAILGDLNRTRDEVLPLLGDSMELVEGDPTYPSTSPVKSIDHIALSGLKVCAVETVRLPVSDHRALIVDVQ